MPVQKENDTLDYRSLLHRDGSVLSFVPLDQLEEESGGDDALYQALGCKLIVGMPFKDIATSDTIVMDEVSGDANVLRTIKRLQDIGN